MNQLLVKQSIGHGVVPLAISVPAGLKAQRA